MTVLRQTMIEAMRQRGQLRVAQSKGAKDRMVLLTCSLARLRASLSTGNPAVPERPVPGASPVAPLSWVHGQRPAPGGHR